MASTPKPGADAKLPVKDTLTVVTLNELNRDWTKHNFPHGATGPKTTETLEQTKARHQVLDKWLLDSKPDVILLQEVGLDRAQKGGLDALKKEYHVMVASNTDLKDVKVPATGGCAVLLRRDGGWDPKTKELPFLFTAQNVYANYRRQAMVVITNRGPGTPALVFISVHLEGVPSAAGDGMRLSQIADVVEFARANAPGAIIVLGGDFNQDLSRLGPINDLLAKSYHLHRVPNSAATFPRNKSVYDHVYVTGEHLVKSAIHAVYPSNRTESMPLAPYEWPEWGSDHAALTVQVQLPK